MRGDRPLWGQAYYAAKAFTPHARGSTQSVNHQGSSFFVYPACAGIDPKIGMIVSTSARLPRMRGDRPQVKRPTGARSWFTPHARGSTEDGAKFRGARHVYPACAGIDLYLAPLGMIFLGLPRMRGDRPHEWGDDGEKIPFTPHARGSTRKYSQKHGLYYVYPACAGIDLLCFSLQDALSSLPRMRGDRPLNVKDSDSRQEFTPHARGSTAVAGVHQDPCPVYPACAGIDL